MKLLDDLYFHVVVKNRSRQAQNLARAGKYEDAFRSILSFQYGQPSIQTIWRLIHENPLKNEGHANDYLIAAEVGARNQAAAELTEKAASLLSQVQALEALKQGPMRVVQSTGYGGFVGIASSSDIARCDIGQRKRSHVEALGTIAEKQANLGLFKEAGETLRQMRSLAGGISISDYAEMAATHGGGGWLSTWAHPQEEADHTRQTSLAKTDAAAGHVALLERMRREAKDEPENGSVALAYVRECIQKGQAGKAIAALERLGLHFRSIMKVVVETIEQTRFEGDSLRSQAVSQAVGYAFSKREEHTYRRRKPDPKMIDAALYAVSLGVKDKRALEDLA